MNFLLQRLSKFLFFFILIFCLNDLLVLYFRVYCLHFHRLGQLSSAVHLALRLQVLFLIHFPLVFGTPVFRSQDDRALQIIYHLKIGHFHCISKI
eukprot:UN02604